MKKKLWTILLAAISTSLLAQDATNSAPPAETTPPATPPAIAAPPPATEPAPAPAIEVPTNNAPAPAPATAKAKKKKTAKKAVAAHKPVKEFKSVPLVPGAAVVAANHVNVRSKAGLVGEIITRMTNGEPVTVIEEITLKNSKPDEPSAWAKIQLPADAHVWLKSSYIDTNDTVKASKLNLRAGPGENYGLVGLLHKGDAVQPITTKGDWTQIQAPTNAYAYMAAAYLTQSPEAIAAATPTTQGTVGEGTQVAPPTTEMTVDTNQMATSESNQPPAMAEGTTNPAPVVEETNQTPPAPRIVAREGIVRGTFSVQAPTHFELFSPDNFRTIDYLYGTNIDFNRYKGMHIIVTGQEGLDERWKNTPVLTVQDIQVIE